MKKQNLVSSEFGFGLSDSEGVRIFIVEDNTRHLNVLKAKLNTLGYPVVGHSTLAREAIPKIKNVDPNIIILDVNLENDGDGIVLARKIREFSDAALLFITAQGDDETIQGAVSVNPSGYLAKPVNPVDLKANIELAIRHNNTAMMQEEELPNKEFLTVRTGEKLQLLRFEEIQLLSVEVKNYITLVNKNGKRFVIKDSLKNMMNSVLPDYFIRTHRSFVVNMNYISFINEKEQMLYLAASDSAPIGKSYRKQVYQKMNIRY